MTWVKLFGCVALTRTEQPAIIGPEFQGFQAKTPPADLCVVTLAWITVHIRIVAHS